MNNNPKNIAIRINALIFHLVLYYVAWFGAIEFAARKSNSIAVTLVFFTLLLQILFQIFIMKRTQGLVLMMTIFLCMGIIVDTLLLKAGVIQFSANPFGNAFSPPWMMSLWLSFSMIFYALLESLYHRYVLLGLLSFIFFPIAYVLGAHIGAAHFFHGDVSSLIVGFICAILFPSSLFVFNYMNSQ